MEQVNSTSSMGIFIVESIKMGVSMALEATNGSPKVHSTKGTSKMDSGMAKANGKKKKPNTMEAMVKDSNKDMESFIFRVATFTKEISFKTKNKDTVKCFGLTGASIRGNGKMVLSTAKVKSI